MTKSTDISKNSSPVQSRKSSERSSRKSEQSLKPDKKKEKPPPKKKIEKNKVELSEEDKKLQDELNLLIEKLSSKNQALYPNAFENLRSLIRASTTSVTSVPKPLKFLRPHYSKLKEIHKTINDLNVARFCADVISVLAMTSAPETSRDCLHYRLLGSKEPISAWGHEYVRHLATEIADEWNLFDKNNPSYQQKADSLLNLARDIVPYQMKHNAEAEAVDLLMEMEHLDLLAQYIDAESQPRVCMYLTSCVPFVPDEENAKFLETAMEIYKKFDKQIETLRCAIMLNDMEMVEAIFLGCKDLIVQKQMAFILGRHQIFFELKDDVHNTGELKESMYNSNLSQYFLALARELDIMEPKIPEDIYKSHLEPSRATVTVAPVNSAHQNLAASFTNGFVNVAFCVDKLIKEDANKWFYKNKDYGMMTAAASQGLIYRWEVDVGLKEIDKYLYSNDEYIKAGSLLAVGIISNGVYNECDPAQAILSDYVRSDKSLFRIGSIFGLGLAYANSKRKSVQETVIPLLMSALTDPSSNNEVLGITALSLGFVCVATGTEHPEVSTAIWNVLSEKLKKDMKDTNLRYLALGIALIFLGKQQAADVMIETMKVCPEPYGSMSSTLLEIAAYAGTGNVLKIQHLLHICSEHYETPKDEKKNETKDAKDDKKKDEKKKDTKDDKKKDSKKDATSDKPKVDLSLQQSVAVLGIALIAMGEDVGSSMSFRLFGHLIRCGEACIRRAVPLALGIISVSNPQLNIVETLSKFSHDADPETAYSAIFALGLVGAGTNNARLALMLRQLAAYYQKDSLHMMLVRIAQGMVHMGKGTMTLSPFHSDRQLMSPSAVAGLLATCFAFLDSKNTILAKQHYLLYSLVPAIQARLLITFEHTDHVEGLKQFNVNVRVGQAVDVVGQAGKPKTITGFQTSMTPVLLAIGDRAELAVEEYVAVSPILEGFVILKKVQTDTDKTKKKRVK